MEERKKVLLTDDKISFGQCFNLAHNECESVLRQCYEERTGLKSETYDQMLKDRTFELFEIKKEIETKLAETHGK